MSTTKNTQNQQNEHDPAADALAGAFEGMAGDTFKAMPAEGQGLIRSAIGIISREVAGMLGRGSSNLAWKIAKNRGVEDKQAVAIANTANMVGRSVITTIVPKIKDGYTLVQETLARHKQQKVDFAQVDQTLEIVRFEQKRNSQISGTKIKSFFFDMFKKAVPDALLNAVTMSIDGIQEYSEFNSLSAKKSKDPTEWRRYNEIKGKREKQGALTEYKDQGAAKAIELIEKHAKWMPGVDGLPPTSPMVELTTSVPFVGDLTQPHGVGRANALRAAVRYAGMAYEGYAPSFLKNIFVDKSAAKIAHLQKKTTADQMIKALNVVFKNDNAPIRLIKMPGASAGNLPVSDYLVDIFARHNEDMGRPPLSGEMKRKLSEACDVIAAAMQDANRQLSPLAMRNLVDGKKGIIEYTNGKVSGIKSDEALEEFIQSFISDKKLTRKSPVLVNEYYRNFSREEMDASWKALSADEQMIWASNFPDEVLDDITGDKTYARSLRTKHNDLWQPMFEAVVRMLPKGERDLKEAGITDDLVERVVRITKEMRKDPKTTLLENQQEVMRLTAEIGIRLEQQEPGSISKLISHAKRRDAKLKGLNLELEEEEIKAKEPPHKHAKKGHEHAHDDEIDHAGESRHFRDKLGEKHERGNWRDEVPQESSEEKIRRLTAELELEKRNNHRRGKRHVGGEEMSYYDR